jgi:hypothetical protein
VKVKQSEFVRIWNESESERKAAYSLKMSLALANETAERLRKKGLELQHFRDRNHTDEVFAEDYEPAFTVPEEPTQFGPGSPEKVRLMQQRVASGQPLWHPDDATVVTCDPATRRREFFPDIRRDVRIVKVGDIRSIMRSMSE